MRSAVCLCLIAGAYADTLSYDQFANIDTRVTGTTVEAACDAATGDNQQWGNITEVLYAREYDECTNSSLVYNGEGCDGECCAAYSNVAYGGQYCSGPYCALSSAGEYGGTNCMGYKCAAYSSNGCPALNNDNMDSCDGCSPTFTILEYISCCTTNQATGCIGEQCAYMCSGSYCGSYCLLYGCAMNCTGSNCGLECQADRCASNCTGHSCGWKCLGNECARNCRGPLCGQSCTNDHCARNCSGSNCGKRCVGAYCSADCEGAGCGFACLGDHCARNCSGPPSGTVDDGNYACGVQSNGKYSAYGCTGHGCGKHCTGEYCAAHAASIYTTTDIIENVSNPVRAINCWHEWISRAMAIRRSTLITASPTAAPTTPPTSARRFRRTEDTDDDAIGDSFDNSTCEISTFAEYSTPNLDLAAEGPAHHCNGYRCGYRANGAFAASFCSGQECGHSTTGLFASAACTGNYCGRQAAGSFAASFCYGSRCAYGASGNWSGSYCIGNECAYGVTGQQAGWCCVGLNCSSLVNTASCADETNAGTPLNLGSASIFKPDCRRVIDTDSAAWTNFSSFCAGGHNVVITPYQPTVACSVSCTLELSRLLRFYNIRQHGDQYGTLRTKNSLRWLRYQKDNSTDDAYFIATYVLVGVVATILLTVVGYQVWKSARSPFYSPVGSRLGLDSM